MQAAGKIAKAAETSELDNAGKAAAGHGHGTLGKIAEDGRGRSGGEWQRIAMARLYYQDAELKNFRRADRGDRPGAGAADLPEVFEAVSGYDNDYDYAPIGRHIFVRLIIAIEDGKAMEQGSHGRPDGEKRHLLRNVRNAEEVVSVKKKLFPYRARHA